MPEGGAGAAAVVASALKGKVMSEQRGNGERFHFWMSGPRNSRRRAIRAIHDTNGFSLLCLSRQFTVGEVVCAASHINRTLISQKDGPLNCRILRLVSLNEVQSWLAQCNTKRRK